MARRHLYCVDGRRLPSFGSLAPAVTRRTPPDTALKIATSAAAQLRANRFANRRAGIGRLVRIFSPAIKRCVPLRDV